MTGWCTRYGDVLALIAAVDGRVCILNSGDELQLTLPADALLPVPAGKQRTLLWRSYGWNKEGDPNNAGGTWIWPLEADLGGDLTIEEDEAWQRKWNTRWVDGDRFRRSRAEVR